MMDRVSVGGRVFSPVHFSDSLVRHWDFCDLVALNMHEYDLKISILDHIWANENEISNFDQGAP